MIGVVGLSHRNAGLEVRERLAIDGETLPKLLGSLLEHGAIAEAFVLSTCNRVEVYVAPSKGDDGLHTALSVATNALVSIGGEPVRKHLVHAHGGDALLHLFRVAASLDSLVVGEPQILGQLKDAIEKAREHRALGSVLGSAAHKAVRVGKRVRSETSIGAGQVSVSSVAVDLARQIFTTLEGRKALLIGAGEMAESAARLLARSGAELRIINRSKDRAKALSQAVGGSPRTWNDLETTLVEVDIVIASTASPVPILNAELIRRVKKARRGKSLFLIDIAVPRDIDPLVNRIDDVFLYDIDDLSQIVAQAREGRATEAQRAHDIVIGEASEFEAWRLEQVMLPTILEFRSKMRTVLHAELERSLNGKLKHLSDADRDALTKMMDAATNKLTHSPVARLRSLARDPRAGDYLDFVRDLFDLRELPGIGEFDSTSGDTEPHVAENAESQENQRLSME